MKGHNLVHPLNEGTWTVKGPSGITVHSYKSTLVSTFKSSFPFMLWGSWLNSGLMII